MAKIPGATVEPDPDTETTTGGWRRRWEPPQPVPPVLARLLPRRPAASREFRDALAATWEAAGGWGPLRDPVAAAEQAAPRGAGSAELHGRGVLDGAAAATGATVRRRHRRCRPEHHLPPSRLAAELAELRRLPSPELGDLPRRFPRHSRQDSSRPSLPCLAVHTPCPPPPPGTTASPARPAPAAHSLPELRAGRRLRDELGLPWPPQRRSLVGEVPHRTAAAPGDGNTAAADLRRLARVTGGQAPGRDRQLSPLLAALTRRSGDGARGPQTQQEQPRERWDSVSPRQDQHWEWQDSVSPQRKQPREWQELVPLQQEQWDPSLLQRDQHREWWDPGPLRHPLPGPIIPAAPQVPRPALGAAVPLRSFGPLVGDVLGTEEEVAAPGLAEDLRLLYGELRLPGERLRFDRQPLLQPPASERQLRPPAPPGPLEPPPEPPVLNAELGRVAPGTPAAPATLPWPRGGSWRRWWRSSFGLDDFLKLVATADTDFLHVVFGLHGAGWEEPVALEHGCEQEAPPTLPQPEPPASAAAAERFEPGLWKPGLLQGAVAAAPGRLQRRLERLWAALHVPGRQRVAMAAAAALGSGWLRAWEAAAGRIQRRELLLAHLEALEEAASDPDRWFWHGGAAGHAAEGRRRRRLLVALARGDAALGAVLRGPCGAAAAISFHGWPYAHKMRWDRVEMLYWLQQRRRAALLLLPARGAARCRAELPGAAKGQ